MLNRDEIGSFYHDIGFINEQKKFKLFVFSDLFGKYRLENKRLYYDDKFYFYISSIDDNFMTDIYNFLSLNQTVVMDKQIIHIKSIKIINTPIIKKQQDIWLKTLSPITVYRKIGDKTKFYSPSDVEFTELIVKNLYNKIVAYNYPVDNVTFEITDYRNVKEKMVIYKNCYYLSYRLQMKCNICSDAFAFLYNAGVSSKGSCGFGMIDVVNEKNSISI